MLQAQPAHQRYLHKPFVGSSHTWALEQCRDLPRTAKVLDIGSGSGAIGAALKQKGVTNLHALETDLSAAQHTKDIYLRIETSLEAYAAEKFDLIFLLDVLEHVTQPEKMYASALSLLNPDGRLLVSVPNVTHWSVRFGMLCGKFSYADRGILDRTHYRFFTRSSFLQLLESPENVRIDEMAATIEPAEFVLPKFIWDNQLWCAFSRFRLWFAHFWPGLMAYQHLAVISKEA
jgi:2-polyprenyl-3-methyl-5-hydroxy-6-metoxy-1,4-benzoquinol methylase